MPSDSYQTAQRRHYSKLKPSARKMRRESTPAEAALWEMLRRERLGATFRRQHVMGQFIVDFVCLSKKVIVEADGPVHESGDAESRDRARDACLLAMGFKVLHFANRQVLDEPGSVEAEIRRHVAD